MSNAKTKNRKKKKKRIWKNREKGNLNRSLDLNQISHDLSGFRLFGFEDGPDQQEKCLDERHANKRKARECR